MPSLKQQVLQMISVTEDDNLLELIKTDIEFFSNNKTDIIDDLYYSDKDDLLNLANEPDIEDTLTEAEFKEATARWRTK